MTYQLSSHQEKKKHITIRLKAFKEYNISGKYGGKFGIGSKQKEMWHSNIG